MTSVRESERYHAVFISTGGERESIHKSIFETITIEGGKRGADEPGDIYTGQGWGREMCWETQKLGCRNIQGYWNRLAVFFA